MSGTLKGPQTLFRQKLKKSLAAQDEETTRAWLGEMLGQPVTATDLMEFLSDGVALCKCVNKIEDNKVSDVNVPKGKKKLNPFQKMENIKKFAEGCADILDPEVIFEPLDLTERKNPNKVLACICRLAQVGYAMGQISLPPALEAKEKSEEGTADDADTADLLDATPASDSLIQDSADTTQSGAPAMTDSFVNVEQTQSVIEASETSVTSTGAASFVDVNLADSEPTSTAQVDPVVEEKPLLSTHSDPVDIHPLQPQMVQPIMSPEEVRQAEKSQTSDRAIADAVNATITSESALQTSSDQDEAAASWKKKQTERAAHAAFLQEQRAQEELRRLQAAEWARQSRPVSAAYEPTNVGGPTNVNAHATTSNKSMLSEPLIDIKETSESSSLLKPKHKKEECCDGCTLL